MLPLTQVQDLACDLVEPHEVHTGPFLALFQVPLDDIPSLRRVNCTTQLGVTQFCFLQANKRDSHSLSLYMAYKYHHFHTNCILFTNLLSNHGLG